MRVRWTSAAANDLERISDYIAEDNPDAARRIATIILGGVGTLAEFPHSGRTCRVEETRELVFAALPFVVVYEVHTDIQILRILHGAQSWPL
jgi:toxin ParE1/3/4